MSRTEILKRIDELENQKFMIDMIDRWSREDFATSAHLAHEIRELKKLLG